MLYDLIHVLVGVLTVGLVFVHPALTVMGTIVFLIYQLDEDWHIKNGAWKDIKEFMIGYFIASAFLLFLFVRGMIIRGGF